MKLNEWQDAKGNKVNITSTAASKPTSSGSSNTGFKKRFEKLLDYAKNHKGPEINKAEVKSLSDDGFFYTEKIRGGYSFYDRDIQVYIGSQTEAWRLRVHIDNKLDVDLSGMGWPELLKTLRYYITVPVTTTPEYKELLTEWVDVKGKKVSMTPTSSSQPATTDPIDHDYRYGRLLAQIKSDGIATYKVNEQAGPVLDITVDTAKKKNLNIRIEYQPDTNDYTFQVGEGPVGKGWDYFDDILELLIAGGVIRYTDFCESYSSYADDFKTYENLWD